MWNTEAEETFTVGDWVRSDVRYSGEELSPYVGRVVGTRGRIVAVKFSAHDFRSMYVNGSSNVPAEFAGPNVGAFDVDWLHRVIYVRSHHYGPGMMPGRSEYIGARVTATGAKGYAPRTQITVPFDHATSGGMSGDGAHEGIVSRFARERAGMVRPVLEMISARNGWRLYAVTETGTCECSEEFGPCEFHAETLVIREGASLHTADELGSIFLADAVSVGAELSPYGLDVQRRVREALADGRWLPDGELSDELSSCVWQVENTMPDGVSVWREDGYRIMRVTGGPLA